MTDRPVPVVVEQIRNNMLDHSNNQNARYNYYQTMLNIKEYADRACFQYERKTKNL